MKAKIDPFSKIKKSIKRPKELISLNLTEKEAKIFLASIKSFREPALVRVASKITRKLYRFSHLRSVGLLEVLKNE